MKPRSLSRVARWKLAALVSCLALLTAGCSSSTSSSTSASASATASAAASSPAASASASASTAALCASATALRTSLDNLRNISVGTGAVSQLRANLSDVSAALSTLVSDAHGQWQTQSSALSAALSKLGTAVSDLAAHPGASTVSGVVTAIRGVTTAGQNLLAALNTSCPSASPSPSGS